MAKLDDLPDELLCLVVENFDEETRMSFRLACKDFYAFSLSNQRIFAPDSVGRISLKKLLAMELWPVFNPNGDPAQAGPNPVQSSQTEFFACHICVKLKPALHFSNNMMRGPKRKCSQKNGRHMRYCIPCGVRTAKYLRGREFHYGAGLYDSRKVGVVCWECGKFADQEDKGFRELPQKDHNLCLHCVATSNSWEARVSRAYDDLVSQGKIAKVVKLHRQADVPENQEIPSTHHAAFISMMSSLGKRKLSQTSTITERPKKRSTPADNDAMKPSSSHSSSAADDVSMSGQDTDDTSSSSDTGESSSAADDVSVSDQETDHTPTSNTTVKFTALASYPSNPLIDKASYNQHLRATGFTHSQAEALIHVLTDMVDRLPKPVVTPMSPEEIRSVLEEIPRTNPTEERMQAARGYKMPPVMRKRYKEAGKSYKTNKFERQPTHVHYD